MAFWTTGERTGSWWLIIGIGAATYFCGKHYRIVLAVAFFSLLGFLGIGPCTTDAQGVPPTQPRSPTAFAVEAVPSPGTTYRDDSLDAFTYYMALTVGALR